MKTPLTTIMMAMESIKRALPAEHSHSVRAATFIDVATQRLAALMDELWNAGDSLAATIVTPHERIDLTDYGAGRHSRKAPSVWRNVVTTPHIR